MLVIRVTFADRVQYYSRENGFGSLMDATPFDTRKLAEDCVAWLSCAFPIAEMSIGVRREAHGTFYFN